MRLIRLCCVALSRAPDGLRVCFRRALEPPADGLPRCPAAALARHDTAASRRADRVRSGLPRLKQSDPDLCFRVGRNRHLLWRATHRPYVDALRFCTKYAGRERRTKRWGSHRRGVSSSPGPLPSPAAARHGRGGLSFAVLFAVPARSPAVPACHSGSEKPCDRLVRAGVWPVRVFAARRDRAGRTSAGGSHEGPWENVTCRRRVACSLRQGVRGAATGLLRRPGGCVHAQSGGLRARGLVRQQQSFARRQQLLVERQQPFVERLGRRLAGAQRSGGACPLGR